jgi:hypothetical protein
MAASFGEVEIEVTGMGQAGGGAAVGALDRAPRLADRLQQPRQGVAVGPALGEPDVVVRHRAPDIAINGSVRTPAVPRRRSPDDAIPIHQRRGLEPQ